MNFQPPAPSPSRPLWALSLPLLLAFVGLWAFLGTLPPVQAQPPSTLIWPISGTSTPDTPSVSSPFGPRWQASQNRTDYHPGLDIAAPQGTPIHVITDGVVSKVGWLSTSSGLAVIVYHPSLSIYSAYLHLDATTMTENQTVTQGEVIGTVGNSGTTEFMHLHFEIRVSANNYPASTRNPMDYLPRPEVTTPTLQLLTLDSDPIYSPTVTLYITAPRSEIDVNQIHVILQDRASGAVLDDQLVDFNQRLRTGDDSLNQDGVQLTPGHYNTAASQYELTAYFYALHGNEAFTLTAQVADLDGHTSTVVATAGDLTPPGKVTTLTAVRTPPGFITLHWIAPGDSGFVGQADHYDIRTAPEPINNVTWSNATPLPSLPTPVLGGQPQTWIIPDPDGSAPFYVALRATDVEGNLSLLSNTAQASWQRFLPIIIH